MELPPEVMEGLSQLVVRGIKEAEQKINQAQEESIRPDKLLRGIPVVGSLVNWFSPPAPETDNHVAHRPTVSHSFDIRTNNRTPLRSRTQGSSSISASPSTTILDATVTSPSTPAVTSSAVSAPPSGPS